MTRRRWIADEVSGNRAALVGEHADHLSRVLRAQVGQQFDIATGAAVRQGRITSVAPGRVEFELGQEIPSGAIPKIILLLSVFKFDRMEWAIEKCTELGVARIIPVIAERTEAHLAAAAPRRLERWQRIALQASEQSRRVAPPEITHPVPVKEAVGLPGSTRILLSEVEREVTVRDILSSQPSDNGVLLAFGPEGGWTEAELTLFREAGWQSASLGDTILRCETAAIAAMALAVAELR